MFLREAKVLARVDEKGNPVVTGGRVEIRYKAGVSKSYQAAARNLAPIPGEALLPDDACSAASPDDAKSSGARGKSKSKAEAMATVHPTAASSDAAIAYADGACSGNPGPCGLGVVMLLPDGSRHELSEYLGTGTNNIAELTAVQRAAELLRKHEIPAARVHTDSKYSIGVLSQGWKAKANVDLIRDVKDAVKRAGGIALVYVPGHAGVLLNERADALARQAVETRKSTGWVEITPRTPQPRT